MATAPIPLTPSPYVEFIRSLEQLPEGTPDSETLDILAWTMLGEAANQGDEGLAAIANVIQNRAASGIYPTDLKKVALQNKQFSTWNKGQGGNAPKSRYPKDSEAFQNARAIAADVVSGRRPDITGGATHYWSPKGMKAMGYAETPYWAEGEKSKWGTLELGDHVFLPKKPVPPANIPNSPMQGASAPQPMDKPKSVRLAQALNGVFAPPSLPAPRPLNPNNPLEQRTGLAPATVVKTVAIDPRTGFPPQAPATTSPRNMAMMDPLQAYAESGYVAKPRFVASMSAAKPASMPTVQPGMLGRGQPTALPPATPTVQAGMYGRGQPAAPAAPALPYGMKALGPSPAGGVNLAAGMVPTLGQASNNRYTASMRFASPNAGQGSNIIDLPYDTMSDVAGQNTANSAGKPVRFANGKVYTPSNAPVSGVRAPMQPVTNRPAPQRPGGLFGAIFGGGNPISITVPGGGSSSIGKSPSQGQAMTVDPNTSSGSTLSSMGFSPGALVPAATIRGLESRGYF